MRRAGQKEFMRRRLSAGRFSAYARDPPMRPLRRAFPCLTGEKTGENFLGRVILLLARSEAMRRFPCLTGEITGGTSPRVLRDFLASMEMPLRAKRWRVARQSPSEACRNPSPSLAFRSLGNIYTKMVIIKTILDSFFACYCQSSNVL